MEAGWRPSSHSYTYSPPPAGRSARRVRLERHRLATSRARRKRFGASRRRLQQADTRQAGEVTDAAIRSPLEEEELLAPWMHSLLQLLSRNTGPLDRFAAGRAGSCSRRIAALGPEQGVRPAFVSQAQPRGGSRRDPVRAETASIADDRIRPTAGAWRASASATFRSSDPACGPAACAFGIAQQQAKRADASWRRTRPGTGAGDCVTVSTAASIRAMGVALQPTTTSASPTRNLTSRLDSGLGRLAGLQTTSTRRPRRTAASRSVASLGSAWERRV